MENITLEDIKNRIMLFFQNELGNESELYQTIKERNDKLKIEIKTPEAFSKYYKSHNGNSASVPLGFFELSSKTVYLRDINFTHPSALTTAIHEIIHALSFNGTSKLGLKEINDNQWIGRSFNEMATCYITAKIIGKGSGGSYSKDYRDTFNAFLNTTNISDKELYQLFFQSEKWISDDIAERFNNANLYDLKELITLYDIRTTPEFNKKRLIDILENSIKINGKKDDKECKNKLADLKDYFGMDGQLL